MNRTSHFQIHQLTRKMKDPDYPIRSNTLLALQFRELVDDNGQLTEAGRNLAISSLPLGDQCVALGIEIEQFAVMRKSHGPERNLMDNLQQKCESCVWAEGRDVLLGIHACALDILRGINTLGERDAATRYIEAQFTINQKRETEIIAQIEKCREEEYLRNYVEVYDGIRSVQDFPEVGERHMILLFRNALTRFRVPIAKLLFSDPYEFRKGWPDLTVLYESSFSMIEVKYHDRLISSQIRTMPKLAELGMPIEVGMVSYLE